MVIFIYIIIISCIPLVFWYKIRHIYEELQKIREDNYFVTDGTNNCILAYKKDVDNKIQMLKLDVIDIENKFHNLQQFYNKRMNNI